METVCARVVKFDPDGSFVMLAKDVEALRIPGLIVFEGSLQADRDPGLIAGFVDEVRAADAGDVEIVGQLDRDAPARSATRRLRGLMKGRRIASWTVDDGLLVPVHPALDPVPVELVGARR